jgi:hypothetical protein
MARNYTEQFDTAIQTVTQDRGEDYGHPAETFKTIAHMQSMISHCSDPAVRHALNMVIIKIVRLAETPNHMDSVLDIAGYARCIAMILEKNIPADPAQSEPGS